MKKAIRCIALLLVVCAAFLNVCSCGTVGNTLEDAFVKASDKVLTFGRRADVAPLPRMLRSRAVNPTEAIPEPVPEEIIKLLAPLERDYHADDKFVRDTITVNHSDYEVPEDMKTKFAERILADMEDIPVSFYAIDLETGVSFGYNADDRISPACTLKAGVALYALREIIAGKADFEDYVTYERKHYVMGTGNIRRRGYGAEVSIKELLELMIIESDNIAYYMLIDYFGYDGYNEMMKELGCSHEIHEGSRWAKMTAHDLGLVWLEIYRFKDSCEEGEFLWYQLTHNKYNQLDFALNDYTSHGYKEIAHKSGFSATAFNDAGIVMAEHPYMIVYMTEIDARTYAFIDGVPFVDKLLRNFHEWLDTQNGQQ